MLAPSRPATVPPPATLLVTLRIDQLRALVAEAVVDALEGEPAKPAAPALIDTAALMRHLSCSDVTIRNLRRQGLPTVFVGESPRFELADVLAWLRARRAAAAE